mmetsp:Transcript_15000/g.27683  ORF Transcript_15000/g.27683 Transcript_15000/m.27683 type:complete len:249 (-) Transcript_15000:83-829(-)
MSSLRNAVKRTTHKERAQPSYRKKLGLLEKKKDYRVRAKDFKEKKSALDNLQKKAADRNPDEFYFKMVRARTKDGVHTIRKEQEKDEVLKLIRSQNLAYLKLNESLEESRIRKLRENLHFIDVEGAPTGRHTIFLDDEEEYDNFDKATYFETSEAFADNPSNRPTKKQLAEGNLLVAGTHRDLKRASSKSTKSYVELEARMKRQKKIKRAMEHIQLTKNLAGKGAKTKIKNGEKGQPAVYRWKQERKR